MPQRDRAEGVVGMRHEAGGRLGRPGTAARRPHREPRDGPPTDRGESLVELLIAVMIMGVAATAVMGEVLMSASTSQLYRGLNQSLDFLQSWAEQVAAEPYLNCADGSSSSPPAGAGLTRPTATVQFWRDGGFVSRDEVPGCQQPADQRSDTGLQRWTLTVSSPGAGLSDTTQHLTVVKRNPCTAVTQAGCWQ